MPTAWSWLWRNCTTWIEYPEVVDWSVNATGLPVSLSSCLTSAVALVGL